MSRDSRLWNGTFWATVDSVPTGPCANEDVNHTGIYEASEDVNNNGKLDPGTVATVSPASVTTNSTGSATVQVVYPKDHAYYVTVQLTATCDGTGDGEHHVRDLLVAWVGCGFRFADPRSSRPLQPLRGRKALHGSELAHS